MKEIAKRLLKQKRDLNTPNLLDAQKERMILDEVRWIGKTEGSQVQVQVQVKIYHFFISTPCLVSTSVFLSILAFFHSSPVFITLFCLSLYIIAPILLLQMPEVDVMLLQEVSESWANHSLVSSLSPLYPYIVYDVGVHSYATNCFLMGKFHSLPS